jgi:outer membrane receptor for Fe3+-dicitrate
LQTGTPITSYLAHPVYENAGEIPQYGRGSEGRTPTTWIFDLSASYMLKLAGKHRVTFRTDVFNIFNQQKVTAYDSNADVGIGTSNENYMRPITYDAARSVRLGVKYQF